MEEQTTNSKVFSIGKKETFFTESGNIVSSEVSAEPYEISSMNMAIADSESPLITPMQQDKNYEGINLATLLHKWGLYDELFSFLSSQKITLDGLLYMKEKHFDELLAGKNVNTKIIFEHKLGVWQNECGIYNLRPQDIVPVRSPTESWLNSITSPATSSNITYEELSVSKILNATEQGKGLLKSYNENGVLTPADRTSLVHKLIQYFTENNISLSVSKIRHLSEQIIRVFPTEHQYTYFISRGKLPPKGKLWDRYQGRKRALKKLTSSANPTNPTKLGKIMETLNEKENSSPNIPSEQLKEIYVSLKHLRKWDEVIPKWKQTAQFRRDMLDGATGITVQQIFQDWPLYKYAQAPELIDIDYRYRYPDKSFSYIHWEKFCTSAEHFFEERIKDSLAKHLLKQLKLRKDILDTDNLNILRFQLLHAILVPSSRIVNKKRVKYTIHDSQLAFTLAVAHSNEIDRSMADKREECAKLGITFQPIIIVAGPQYNYSDFYVSIDDVKFKFNTYLEALEYCFKVFFVFNLKYPTECTLVWNFIEKFLFSINGINNKFPIVDTFIADISHMRS